MKDYYAILGVNRTASVLEIKRAYRRLAVLYHPDKNPDPRAEQFFKEVNEAYDVLGDESKKNWYDYKFQTPTVQVSNAPQEQGPRHRDPAYRRRRPPSPHEGERQTRHKLMQEYLPYFKWANRIGMALLLILAFDYFLPTLTSTEEILEMYGVRRFEVVVTPHHRILMYGDGPDGFYQGEEIEIKFTPFLRTILEVSDRDKNHVVFLRGIYGPVFIIPFILFFTSGLGIIFRHNLVYAFNLGVASALLTISVIYLIFTV